MDSLRHDLAYSLRSLSKQPGLVAAAVLSLALGSSVNTAIFSALNTMLFRPLAVRNLDRAVIVYHSSAGSADQGTSFPAFLQYKSRTDVFADAMAFTGARALLFSDGDRRVQVYAQPVTASFFSIADVAIQVGTAFPDAVDRPAAREPVVVLSHRFWRDRFGSDAAIVGRSIDLNSTPLTVVGIASEGFTGFDPEVSADLWIPMTTWAHLAGEPGRLAGEEHWITTVAVLQPGVTLPQAQTAAGIAARGERRADQDTRVRSARERFVGDDVLEVLALGGGAFVVGLLVLVLACTNVANLLIARGAARQREMSLRLALGSSRFRLLRLWLIESLMLSVAAGALSLLLAWWMLDLIVAFRLPTEIGESAAPVLPLDFSLDVRVLAFALGISVVSAVLVGLLTGLQVSKAGALVGLKAGRTADPRFAPGLNVRSAVIAMQMALSLLLLIPCGLLVRSWLNASAISPGFATDHVLLLPISARQAGVTLRKPDGFDQQIVDRVAALPGVDAVTVMDPVPLWFGGSFAHFRAGDDGQGERLRIGHSRVAPRYFDTLRIPLLIGRDFTRADDASAPPVAIVNETLARRLWPEGSAVGRRLHDADESLEIVGVARDAKYLSLADTSTMWVYRPLAQNPSTNVTLSLAVRTTGDPLLLRPAIEREVRALIPEWPLFNFRTLDEGLQLQQFIPRLAASLLGVLGGFGLLLAAVGIYGVMAYAVRQRTHEMGIRLALGAPMATVLRLVIEQGMTVCMAGAVVGLVLAVASSQLLSSFLFGISSMDPITYTIVPTVLMGVALIACYFPARRLTTIDVLQVLRDE
jgi:predicted permease